jgi:hypothetical protein
MTVMQNTFSFYRLGLLIRKQWADQGRLYLLSLGAIAGLLAITFFLWGITKEGTVWIEVSYIFFFIGLYIGGALFAGRTFSDLAQPTTGMHYLAIPATAAEKLVCGILYSQVIFNVAYLVIFYLIRTTAFGIMSMYPSIHLQHMPYAPNMPDFILGFSVAYPAVQALYLLGSVYFKRFSFVKTTLWSALVLVAFFFFFRYVVFPILPERIGFVAGDGFRVFDENGGYVYSFPKGLLEVLKFVFEYIWAPLFWVVAYFRLKEKEI